MKVGQKALKLVVETAVSMVDMMVAHLAEMKVVLSVEEMVAMKVVKRVDR